MDEIIGSLTRAYILAFVVTSMFSLGIALLTLPLVVVLPRTRLGDAGSLVAIAVPSVLVALLGLGSVALVGDIAKSPRGFPPLARPAGRWLRAARGGGRGRDVNHLVATLERRRCSRTRACRDKGGKGV